MLVTADVMMVIGLPVFWPIILHTVLV